MTLFRVNTSGHINVRTEPSLTGAIVTELRSGAVVDRLIGCTLENEAREWTFISFTDAAGAMQRGWVARVWTAWGEQFTDVESAPAPSPAPDTGLWPSPIQARYSISQEFAPAGNGHQSHAGADLAGAVGLPISASAVGRVVAVVHCTRCTPDRPNFASQGIGLWDANAIADRAWGYGFGNYVIVEYPRDGRTLYVIYAHLSAIHIADGAPVQRGTAIGLLGNTGNSTGPHLHLEVRVSAAPTRASVFQLPAMNPREVFAL